MRKLILSLALLVFGFPAIASGQQGAAGDPLIGCYRLEIGPWEPVRHPSNIKYQTPPDELRLKSEVGESRFEQGKTIVRPVIPHGRTPSAYWVRVGEDSIHVIWTNGHAGVHLRMQISANSLHGIATAFTDVIGAPVPRAHAVVRPTSCSGGED